eukprot:CAMPEP_0171062588 /NCGR_PEP_ID=MMETSP0766_2-20121228/5135_1 /TAXON_ID=439317 /ORGANISM="Gambierdiscus australes, Strain CAWD 149" /LENGTH=41 /DNA_ID= /DNA_START= /DNA_END= /DNA_ORIENTATION=
MAACTAGPAAGAAAAAGDTAALEVSCSLPALESAMPLPVVA